MHRRPVNSWHLWRSYNLASLSFAFALALAFMVIGQSALAKQYIENKNQNSTRTEFLQAPPVLIYDGQQAHLLKFNKQQINSCGYALANLPKPDIDFAGRINCEFLDYPITIQVLYDTLHDFRPQIIDPVPFVVFHSDFPPRLYCVGYQFLVGREKRTYIYRNIAQRYPYTIESVFGSLPSESRTLSNLYNAVAGISDQFPITTGAFETFNKYEPEFYNAVPGPVTTTAQLKTSSYASSNPLARMLYNNDGALFLKKMVILGNREKTFDRGVLSVYERHLAEDVYASSGECTGNGVFYLPGPNGYDGRFAFCDKETLGWEQALALLTASANHAIQAGRSDFAAQAYEDMASFISKRPMRRGAFAGDKPEMMKYECPQYLQVLTLATSSTPAGLTYEQSLRHAISLRKKAGDSALMASRMVELLQYQLLMGQNGAAVQTFSDLEKIVVQPGTSAQVAPAYLLQAIPAMVASRISNSPSQKIALYSQALSNTKQISGCNNAFYGLLNDIEQYCRTLSLSGDQNNADKTLKLLAKGISFYKTANKANCMYTINPQLIIDYLSLETPSPVSLKILSDLASKNRMPWQSKKQLDLANVLVPALIRAKLDTDAISLVKSVTEFPSFTINDLSSLRNAILTTQKNDQIKVTPNLRLMESMIDSAIDNKNTELQARAAAKQKAKADAAFYAKKLEKEERDRQLVVDQDLQLASSLSHQAENYYAETMLEIKLRRRQTATKLLPSYCININNIRSFEKAASSLCASVDLYKKHCKPNSYDVVYSNAKAIMCYILAGREDKAKRLYKLADTNLTATNLAGEGYTLSQALNDYAEVLHMEGFEVESKKVISLLASKQSSSTQDVQLNGCPACRKTDKSPVSKDGCLSHDRDDRT